MTPREPTRRRRTGRGIAAAAVFGALTFAAVAGVPTPTALGAPNPFMGESVETTVTPTKDGSYRVQTRQSRELAREFELDFGGTIGDSFRLPDDQIPDGADRDGFDPSGPAPVTPAYLRARYEMSTAAVDGHPVELAFTNNRHQVQAAITQTYPAGKHAADLDYTVKGAAVTSRGDKSSHLQVHVRLLSGKPTPSEDTVLVDQSQLAGFTVTQIDCVTYAPDRVPCGTPSGLGWTVDFGAVSDGVPSGDFVILLAAD